MADTGRANRGCAALRARSGRAPARRRCARASRRAARRGARDRADACFSWRSARMWTAIISDACGPAEPRRCAAHCGAVTIADIAQCARRTAADRSPAPRCARPSARCATQVFAARDALAAATRARRPQAIAERDRTRCRRSRRARMRPADAAVPQRMGHAPARSRARSPRGKTVALPRVDAATRMLCCIAIRDVGRRYRARLSRHSRAARPHCPRVAPRAIDWVLVPGRRLRRRRAAGWAMAAASTTGCCRCCRRGRRASPAPSTCRSSRRCPPAPHDLAVDAIVTETRTLLASRMSARERRRAQRAATALVALATTLAIQIFTSRRGHRDRGARARRSRATSASRRSWIGVFVGLVYAGAMLEQPRLRRLHRALRRDPRVAGVRAAVRRSGIALDGARVPAVAVALLRRSRRS